MPESGRPAPRLTAIPRDIAAVADYERYSRACLDDNAWAYLHSAAADELSWRWNREAYDRLRILPRVLRDVTAGHTRCSLPGLALAHPILLAPVAWQKLFHPDGERASAYAAAALDTGLVLSTLSSYTLEEVAAVGAGPRWFQLYLQPERGVSRALVERAERAGYSGIVFTIDAPLNGVRNREHRAGFQLPPGVDSANLRGAPAPVRPALGEHDSAVFQGLMREAPTWQDVEWLCAATRLPVILKGVLHPDDARIAADLGAAGLIVSNHGGRTLDTLPPALEMLPAIADAVGDRVALLLDGGIRRGSDVFKAIALGARAVLVGRGYIHALAAAGPLGVAHVIRLLRDELEVAMALAGCATLADIGPHTLLPAPR